MLTLYPAAAMVGGVLLTLSLVGGDHHGHEAGHSTDHGDGGGSIVATLASVRFWTYLLTFGGACGALLRLFARTPEPLGAPLSLGAGTAAGLLAQAVIGRAARASDVGTVTEHELVGRLAHVL